MDAAATAAGHVPHVRAGKLRILTMLQSYRSKTFPGVLCLKDVGIKFEGKGSTETFSGMIAPRGLPPDVLRKYEEAFRETVKSPEFLRAADTLGLNVDFCLGDDLRKEVEEGHIYIAELVKTLRLG